MEVARFLRGSGAHPWEVDACSRLAEQDRQTNRARFLPAESSTFTSTAMSAGKRSRSFLAWLAFSRSEAGSFFCSQQRWTPESGIAQRGHIIACQADYQP